MTSRARGVGNWYIVKQLGPYLLGKLFKVRTECVFVINTIPGNQNIVTDRLTRVNTARFDKMDELKRHLYQNDSMSSIFWQGRDGKKSKKQKNLWIC